MAADQRNSFEIDLTYITSRGRWYHASWKGDEAKSGGIATNIGVHFFDMLSYVFGPPTMSVAHINDPSRAAGYLMCGRAAIRWFLSVDRNDLPSHLAKDKTTFRSLMIDEEEFEYSDGFTDLHTRSYEEILAGRGFRLGRGPPVDQNRFRVSQGANRAQSGRPASICFTVCFMSETTISVRFPKRTHP